MEALIFFGGIVLGWVIVQVAWEVAFMRSERKMWREYYGR
jgi:hypothetical protein